MASVPREADGIIDPELQPILGDLYALFPQPGEKRHVERLVIVYENRSLARHRHPEWTLVFYIDVGDPVCNIMVNDEEVFIKPGMAVLMPPRTPHAVPRSFSKRPRLSLALRWVEHYIEGEQK